MLCFGKVPPVKNFMDKRGGGGSIKIFRRKISVSQSRKLSYENPSVFHWFWVSKIFMLQWVMSRISVK